MTRITRVEVIDENGRSYVNWKEDNDITLSYQDDGRTLKVFVNTMKPKTGEERALEALDKFQNDWLLGKKCPETKLEIKNLNSVESIKAEIKLLQSKLEFYEELEKTKSSVEEAYKRVYGAYPPTTPSVSNFEDTRWSVFQAGYNASQEDYKVEEPEELKTLYQMFDGEQYYHRDKIWHIVKIWRSQYEIDRWCDDWDVGFSECLDKLNKGLK
jgi:hypothetical protein